MTLSYLGAKSIGIPLKDLSYSLFPYLFVLLVVAASIAVAIFAVLPTRETLTVELEAARVLAIAILLTPLVLNRLDWNLWYLLGTLSYPVASLWIIIVARRIALILLVSLVLVLWSQMVHYSERSL